MSAAELRQAAETLRARIGRPIRSAKDGQVALIPGPWEPVQGRRVESAADDSWDTVAVTAHADEATYIATMHPGVGLALAHWLEYTFDQGHEGDTDDNGCSECAPAIAVARLINGGAP